MMQVVQELPALWAGWAVCLYLLAALLPLSFFGALIILHALRTLMVLPKMRREDDRRVIWETHLSEAAMFALALAASLSLSALTPWHSSHSVVKTILIIAAIVATVVPKVAIVRQTLLLSRPSLSTKPAIALFVFSMLCVASLVCFYDQSIEAIVMERLAAAHL